MMLSCLYRYLDPLTGLPYATIEAFKMIRKRVSRDNIMQGRALGRNLRSPRLIPGRSSVQKARKSSLCTFSRAKLRKMEARINEAAEQQYVPEALPSHDTDVNFSSRPVPQEHSPHESNLVHSITVTPSESSQEMKSTENLHPSTDYFNTQTMTAESQKEPLWVDIPPPKEGPNDDVYLLEDLTSLDFGPILAHQHDLMNQSQRDDFNIADPRSEGAFSFTESAVNAS
ncbi:hypothetical protein KP509_1Z315000 [Ceratopteris richardii]|nr:hypothetical protein KP509_1Z315000 [Ceratopteris richardii]